MPSLRSLVRSPRLAAGRSLSLLALALLAPSGACKDDSVDKGDIVVKGTIAGTSPGDGLTTGVLWVISPKGPDYGYGSGTSSGSSFDVRLTGGPPGDGLNGGDVGVGLVVLAPPGQDVPRGSVPDASKLSLAGVSTRTAIIYRAGDASFGLSWLSAFPAGLSCGRCVPAGDGETLDTYEPIACSSLEIEAGASLASDDVCHWF